LFGLNDYADHIKSQAVGRDAGAARILKRRSYQVPALVGANRFQGCSEVFVFAGLDLDKYQFIAVPRDKIDFAPTFARAEITRDDAIALVVQMAVGRVFSTPAGTQMLR